MQRLYINPDFEQRLSAAGCTDFSTISALSNQGELVDLDKGRTTRKLELAGETYFFKNVHKAIVGPSVEAILSLRIPHHYCWRELLQVNALKANDIPVVEVAAAGESSAWGVLDYSFLLTREVKGGFLHQLYAEADRDTKLSMLTELGEFVGQAHSRGFFAPVRMKDVVVDSEGKFVVIDRETRWPGARRFTKRKAIDGLTRTIKRQTRDGLEWDSEQIRAHLNGYLSTAPISLTVEQLSELV